MNARRNKAVWAVLVAIFLASASYAEDARLADSRVLVQEYAKRLQSALQDGLSNGGPEAAIAVCRDIAPKLASELSRQSGAKVARVSRRYRNPANAPEEWQDAVLQTLQQRAQDPADSLEVYIEDKDRSRYMKGIRLQPMCVMCHGRVLSETVSQQLNLDYPHDRARGYEPGQLRGGFSVSWPVAEQEDNRLGKTNHEIRK
jgi:hypothetical protein